MFYSDQKRWTIYLTDRRVLFLVSMTLFSIILVISNVVLMVYMQLKGSWAALFHGKVQTVSLSFPLTDVFHFQLRTYPVYYGVCFALALVVMAKIVYDLYSNFNDLNKGQKGTNRFTTIKELKQQYKRIPEKSERYEGGGGVVISRYDKLSLRKLKKSVQLAKKIMQNDLRLTTVTKAVKQVSGKQGYVFIDDSPVNNLIIGTTRSGKGETFVVPTIDAYSRAEKQPSLIINDPKGELAAASYETLKERGYHIEVLNLLDPNFSMGFNPLQLIIEEWKAGDKESSQSACNTVSYSLYNDPNIKDPFWNNSAMSLVNAMTLATIEKFLNEKRENDICMYSVANMLTVLGGDTDIERINALDQYFSQMPPSSGARMQYATSNFAAGNTRAGIFSNAMSKLSIFTLDSIAKMTSHHSVDFGSIGGFGKRIEGQFVAKQENLKHLIPSKLEARFPDGSKAEARVKLNGRWELHYAYSLQEGDQIQLHNQTIQVKKRDETGQIEWEWVKSEVKPPKDAMFDLHLTKFLCFEKPVAVFMVVPDYDESNHVIASIFIRQLYYVLAKKASEIGGKCPREVVFMLDEFGNLPSIEGMAGIITVCLGRNIRFNLIIQAYSQLENRYGDDWKTIVGNCGNQLYILTNDHNTAEQFSKTLGTKTQVTVSRSGQPFSLDKSKTESVEERYLFTPDELLRFKEGEVAISRVIKRQDNEQKRIRANPIYNSGRTSLKYRWEYLADEFDTSKSILDLPLVSKHAYVQPSWFTFYEQNDSSKQLLRQCDQEVLQKLFTELEHVFSSKDMHVLRHLRYREDVEDFIHQVAEVLGLKENEIAPSLAALQRNTASKHASTIEPTVLDSEKQQKSNTKTPLNQYPYRQKIERNRIQIERYCTEKERKKLGEFLYAEDMIECMKHLDQTYQIGLTFD